MCNQCVGEDLGTLRFLWRGCSPSANDRQKEMRFFYLRKGLRTAVGGFPSVGMRRQEPARQQRKLLPWPSEHKPTRLGACSVSDVGAFQPLHVSILASPVQLLSDESVYCCSVGYKSSPCCKQSVLCICVLTQRQCCMACGTPAQALSHLSCQLCGLHSGCPSQPPAASTCIRWKQVLQVRCWSHRAEGADTNCTGCRAAEMTRVCISRASISDG